MNQNNYTSQPLSKLLSGCELESDIIWVGKKNTLDGCKPNPSSKYEDEIFFVLSAESGEYECSKETGPYYQAYDILNDICVRYAEAFFGDKVDDEFGVIPVWRIHPSKILGLLQVGRKEAAEDYIWEHTLFNPKNQ